MSGCWVWQCLVTLTYNTSKHKTLKELVLCACYFRANQMHRYSTHRVKYTLFGLGNQFGISLIPQVYHSCLFSANKFSLVLCRVELFCFSLLLVLFVGDSSGSNIHLMTVRFLLIPYKSVCVSALFACCQSNLSQEDL